MSSSGKKFNDFQFRFRVNCNIPRDNFDIIRLLSVDSVSSYTLNEDIVKHFFKNGSAEDFLIKLENFMTRGYYTLTELNRQGLRTIYTVSRYKTVYVLHHIPNNLFYDIVNPLGLFFDKYNIIVKADITKHDSHPYGFVSESKALNIYLDSSAAISDNFLYGLIPSALFIDTYFKNNINYGKKCKHLLKNFYFPSPTIDEMQDFICFQLKQCSEFISYGYGFEAVQAYMKKSFLINTCLRMKLDKKSTESAYKDYETSGKNVKNINYYDFSNDFAQAKILKRQFRDIYPIPFGFYVYRSLGFDPHNETNVQLRDLGVISTSLLPCTYEPVINKNGTYHVLLKIFVHPGVRAVFPLAYSISAYFKELILTGKSQYDNNTFLYGQQELEVLCQPGSIITITGSPLIIYGDKTVYVYDAEMFPADDTENIDEELIISPSAKRRRI